MSDDQSWHQKHLSQVSPYKVYLGANSSFQGEKKPFCITLGDDVGASSSPNQVEKNKMVPNPPISGIVSFAITDHSTAKPDQTQAAISHSDVNYDPNLDPDKRLKRNISNRLSAEIETEKDGTFGQFENASQSLLVSWSSKKEPVVALSSCEAEYIAASMSVCQALWLDTLLQELKVKDNEAVKLLVDNKSAINLAKHPVAHSRSKHIETRFHFIRDQVSKGRLQLEHCNTEVQVTDIMTKPLKGNRFKVLREMLSIVSVSDLT